MGSAVDLEQAGNGEGGALWLEDAELDHGALPVHDAE